MIIAPIAEATDWVRMSRLRTCASSCEITPRSSSSESSLVIPWVTATAAVLRVAPGRERVRLVAGDHVEPRHRQVRARGQLADHLVEPRRLLLGDRLGAGARDRDLVAEPVGDEVHQQREHEEDARDLDAADRETDHDQQAAESGHQDGRAQRGGEVRLPGGSHRGGCSLVPCPALKPQAAGLKPARHSDGRPARNS